MRNWNIDTFFTDSIDSIVLDGNEVAPACYFLGAVYGIAFNDGLEVDGVMPNNAVKTQAVDVGCVVEGTFEDYRLWSGSTGAAQDKDYVHNYYYNKPIQIAYCLAFSVTWIIIICNHILTVLIKPFLLFRDTFCVDQDRLCLH